MEPLGNAGGESYIGQGGFAPIAKNNPIAVIFISIFWGMLKSGSFNMERVSDTNRLVISVLQAVFVLLAAVDYEALYKWFCEKRQLRVLRSQKGEM